MKERNSAEDKVFFITPNPKLSRTGVKPGISIHRSLPTSTPSHLEKKYGNSTSIPSNPSSIQVTNMYKTPIASTFSQKCSPSFKPLTLRTIRAHRKICPKCTKLLCGKIQKVVRVLEYLKVVPVPQSSRGGKRRRGRKGKRSKSKSCCLAEVFFFFPSLFQVPHHTRTKLAGWACLDSCKQPTTNHTPERRARRRLGEGKHGNRNRESTTSRWQRWPRREKSSTVFGHD